MSGRWLWFWAGLGLLNALLCMVLLVISVAQGNYSRATLNFVCAVVSGGWGSFFLVHARADR